MEKVGNRPDCYRRALVGKRWFQVGPCRRDIRANIANPSDGILLTTDLVGIWDVIGLGVTFRYEFYTDGKWSAIGPNQDDGGNGTYIVSDTNNVHMNGIGNWKQETLTGDAIVNENSMIVTMASSAEATQTFTLQKRMAPAVANDFIGTWEGPSNFIASDGESGSNVSTMILSSNSGNLAGILKAIQTPIVLAEPLQVEYLILLCLTLIQRIRIVQTGTCQLRQYWISESKIEAIIRDAEKFGKVRRVMNGSYAWTQD
jgi:hypothetical protein